MSNKRYAIVCVDDEKVILDSLQEQLEQTFGSKVLVEIAESPEEAWELIQELVDDGYEIVLVISDWLMPNTKGDKFLVDLHHTHPEALTILLTGQADADAVQNARENANLYAYIRKPWRAEDLMEKIRSGFEQAHVGA